MECLRHTCCSHSPTVDFEIPIEGEAPASCIIPALLEDLLVLVADKELLADPYLIRRSTFPPPTFAISLATV